LRDGQRAILALLNVVKLRHRDSAFDDDLVVINSWSFKLFLRFF